MTFEFKPLPHREAIEYFKSKGFAAQLQRFHHLDHWREEHARNWVVAKAMRDDVSVAIRQAMTRALEEGRTMAQFQAELKPTLEKLGWWGRQEMLDPLTGETKEVQLGSMRRLKVIFDTNMRTAHAAGHWAAIMRTKKAFPYLEYVQIDRPSKRHDHARFHGGVWRVDDPIWLRIYPPNGWFCGCHVLQRTEGWMTRNNRTVSDAPDLDEKPWVHKRTGQVFEVPRGVNPGFDANPGAAWLNSREAWEKVTPDLTPERRASELGLIEGLRLQRLGQGLETLTATDAAGQPLWTEHGKAETPAFVAFPHYRMPAGGALLHSHMTDATLSTMDLASMFDSGAASITAITPGGAIWRALRNPTASVRPALAEFSLRLGPFGPDLARINDGQFVYNHALALWLEKNGVITYHFYQTERVRQMLAQYADLLRRLIDGNP